MSNGFQRRANVRFAVLLFPRLAGPVIIRQLRCLDPAAGLLVGVVALAAVVALVALFFARGPVPWPGSLRGPWPCCRLASAWSWCWSPSKSCPLGLLCRPRSPLAEDFPSGQAKR